MHNLEDIILCIDMCLEVSLGCSCIHYLESVGLEYRDEQGCEFLVRLEAQVFLVVPAGFLRIETRAGFDDAVEGERRDELVDGEHLAVVARIPSEEGEKIHESLREVTVLAISSGYLSGRVDPSEREYREAELVAVPLAELTLSVRFEKKGKMCETRLGLLPSESLVEHVMQRQGRKPLLSADNLCNLHEVVVHDIGEVVSRQFVGSLPEHLVVESVGIHLDMSADKVVHLDDGILGHLEADGPVRCLLQQSLCLLLAEGEGIAELLAGLLVVDEGLAGCLCSRTLCVKLLRAVESVVGVA